MILTIDRVNDLLDDMADSFPAALFDGLNGGINLLEEAKPDPEFPEGEMYILGEYCDDLLGQYINLYYGSFAALAEREDWGQETWEDELYTTLSHELTHHMEGRRGLHALDDRDAEELEEYRREYGGEMSYKRTAPCLRHGAVLISGGRSALVLPDDPAQGFDGGEDGLLDAVGGIDVGAVALGDGPVEIGG